MILEHQSELPHHSDTETKLVLSFEGRDAEPSMVTIEVDDGERRRVTLTIAELRSVMTHAERFEKALGALTETV